MEKVMSYKFAASGKVVELAIASLQKKGAARQARWKATCAAERKERARRDERAEFVERYLRVRDDLLSETADWDEQGNGV
jgi:hypothetical protein